MSLFSNNGGIMDQIRCDEESYLIWKWHPKGSNLGESKKENSIRWGSSLRVKDGEVAVFVYHQKDGVMQDFIEGPFDEILKTKNLPILSGIIGLAYDGGTPFQAEIYFINLAQIIQVPFAVPYFDVYDPRFLDFGVPLAARGILSFNIKDYKEFIQLHRLVDFSLEQFQDQIRNSIVRDTKPIITGVIKDENIPVVQIETKIDIINNKSEEKVKDSLEKNFGVNVLKFDIGTIELDKTCEGYKQLMSVTKDITSATIKAETEAKLKNISDRQRIEMENYEESLRIQREEGQYAQHKQTQSANLEALKTEKQAEVGIASAEALGHMGENGAGSINLGEGGTGFNPAAMMTSMALGSVVGQNLAGTMNGVLSNNNSTITPPPIPTTKYYIVDNGVQAGPYELNNIREMIENGKVTKETLVWKNGMVDWSPASSVDEINILFPNIPPIPKN